PPASAQYLLPPAPARPAPRPALPSHTPTSMKTRTPLPASLPPRPALGRAAPPGARVRTRQPTQSQLPANRDKARPRPLPHGSFSDPGLDSPDTIGSRLQWRGIPPSGHSKRTWSEGASGGYIELAPDPRVSEPRSTLQDGTRSTPVPGEHTTGDTDLGRFGP